MIQQLTEWLRRRATRRWCPNCTRHRDTTTALGLAHAYRPARSGDIAHIHAYGRCVSVYIATRELACATCAMPLEHHQEDNQ